MENLRRALEKMKDPRWIMRPMEQEREAINQAFPDTPAPVAPGQPPVNPNAPIKPGALDNMITSLDAQQNQAGVPTENATGSTPFSQKMRYLDTMGQVQKQKFPNMQKRSTLGGGGLNDFGI